MIRLSAAPRAPGYFQRRFPGVALRSTPGFTLPAASRARFADKRKIALHRQWATRSYAIALVFIVGRFVLGVTGLEALGVEIAQAIIWSCLALSVVLADVSIHWKEIRSALTVSVRSGVASNVAKPSMPKNAVGVAIGFS